MIKKIRSTIWCCAVAAPMVWVFGYIDGWGWILQAWAIGFALYVAWHIWTDGTSDPWPGREE